MINHLIIRDDDIYSICQKCKQYCAVSLESFRNRLDPSAADIGHCVALNDRDMVIASYKTGEIRGPHHCEMTDAEFYIKEILL